MENKIFYFSVTGKSFWTAVTLAEEIGNCDVVSLKDYNTANPVRGKRIGFVFPVFQGGLPKTVKNFLSEIKIDGNPYLFSVYTYSHYDGITSLQLREKMISCCTPLDAVLPLKMPSVVKEEQIIKMLLKAELQIIHFAEIVDSEEHYLKKHFRLPEFPHKISLRQNKTKKIKEKFAVIR